MENNLLHYTTPLLSIRYLEEDIVTASFGGFTDENDDTKPFDFDKGWL